MLTARQRKLVKIVMSAWLPEAPRPTFDEWCAAFDELYGPEAGGAGQCLNVKLKFYTRSASWKSRVRSAVPALLNSGLIRSTQITSTNTKSAAARVVRAAPGLIVAKNPPCHRGFLS